jgi:hypothetical protein
MIPVCYNLTQPPEKSKYDFDPLRCKGALAALAALVDLHGTVIERQAIDALFLDIEDLHRRAVERDHIHASLSDLPVYETNSGELVHWSDIDDLIDTYQREPVAELNL